MGKNTKRMRNIKTSVRNGAREMRRRACVKFKNKEKFLIKKHGGKMNNEGIEGLNSMDRTRYEGCRIFYVNC